MKKLPLIGLLIGAFVALKAMRNKKKEPEPEMPADTDTPAP